MFGKLLTKAEIALILKLMHHKDWREISLRKKLITHALGRKRLFLCELKAPHGYSVLTLQFTHKKAAISLNYSPSTKRLQGVQLCFPF